MSSGLGTQSSGATYVYRESSASDTTGQTWSLNPSENLFSWTDWKSLEVADRQVAEAQATYEAVQQSLTLTTAQAYFGVLAAVDTLHAEQFLLRALTLALEQAEEEFKVGLTPITDVKQASRCAVQRARDAYLRVISGIANVCALRQALASSKIS